MRKKLERFLIKFQFSMLILKQAYLVIKDIFRSEVMVMGGKDDEGIMSQNMEITQERDSEMPQNSSTYYGDFSTSNLKGLEEVSEEKVMLAAQATGNPGGHLNSFQHILIRGAAYKSMNVEPVYLFNRTAEEIVVVAREIWEHPNILN